MMIRKKRILAEGCCGICENHIEKPTACKLTMGSRMWEICSLSCALSMFKRQSFFKKDPAFIEKVVSNRMASSDKM